LILSVVASGIVDLLLGDVTVVGAFVVSAVVVADDVAAGVANGVVVAAAAALASIHLDPSSQAVPLGVVAPRLPVDLFSSVQISPDPVQVINSRLVWW